MANKIRHHYCYMQKENLIDYNEYFYAIKTGQIDASDFSKRFHVTQSQIARLGKRHCFSGHSGCVNCLEWNSAGNLLVSGSDDQRICIWNVSNASLFVSYETLHTGNIFSAKFLPQSNDELVISGAACNIIQVQNIQRLNDPLHIIRSHRGRVKRLATAANEPHLFWSASEDGSVRQFDLRDMSDSQVVYCTDNSLMTTGSLNLEAKCIAVNGIHTEQVAVGWTDAAVRVFDRRFVTPSKPFIFTTEGQSEADSRINYFIPKHLSESRRFFNKTVTYVAFSADGNELIANNAGEAVFVYDVRKTCANGSTSKIPSIHSLLLPQQTSSSSHHSSNDSSSCQRLLNNHNNSRALPLTMEQVKMYIVDELLFGHVDDDAGDEVVPWSIFWTRPNFYNGMLWWHFSSIMNTIHDMMKSFLSSKDALYKAIGSEDAAPLTLMKTIDELNVIVCEVTQQNHYPSLRNRPQPTFYSDSSLCLTMHLYLLRSQLLMLRNWRCDGVPAYNNCLLAFQLFQRLHPNCSSSLQHNQQADNNVTDGSNQSQVTMEVKLCHQQLYLTLLMACYLTDRSPGDELHRVWQCYEQFYSTEKLTKPLAQLKLQVLLRSQRYNLSERFLDVTRLLNIPSAHDYEQCYYGTINTHTDIKEANFFGHSGQYIVAGSDDACVYIWNRQTGNVERLFTADSYIVNVVQPHPHECVLATSGLDKEILIWDVQDENYEEPAEVINHWDHLHKNCKRGLSSLMDAWNEFENLIGVDDSVVFDADEIVMGSPAVNLGELGIFGMIQNIDSPPSIFNAPLSYLRDSRESQNDYDNENENENANIM